MKRRQFLKASTSAAGGLMLGFHLPGLARKPYEQEQGGVEINAWLTIDPDDTIVIRVAKAEMGQGVLTSLPMIIAEELEANWNNVRTEYASVDRHLAEGRVYGDMLTVGSSSVRANRKMLQQVGADARERLIKAAAERWLVNPHDCYADYGRVHHRTSDRSINFGAVAGDASRLRVAGVKIKSARDFDLLGLPTPKLDTPAKVDGSAVYGMDVRVDGMVYAAVKHCPVIGGQVRGLRFNVVRERTGVIQAVRMPHAVAVVAEHYWQAQTALDELPVDWETYGYEAVYSQNLKTEFMTSLRQGGEILVNRGRVAQVMDEAEKGIESDYFVPYLAHACMEPMNCTVDLRDDEVEIWTGTQNPEAVVDLATRMTGLPASAVRFHNCFLGGGFGRRSNTDYVEEALLIAREVRRPVQMIWSREEDMRAGQYRPMAAVRFKAGFDLDNNWIAYENHSVVHSIARDRDPDFSGVDRDSVVGLIDMPYSVDHKRISHTARNTHIPAWWWRSVGHSQNAYAMECFTDEMATAAGMDPFDFRRKYLADREDLRHVLEVLARESEWRKQRLPIGSAQGMAIHKSAETVVGMVAEVHVSQTGDLRVDRIVCVVDCGNLVNPLTAHQQVEGGIVFGLSATLFGKLSFDRGVVMENNFDTYQQIQMDDMPEIKVHFELSGGDHWGGLGEPVTPLVAPAICNALYQITGRRVRSLPLADYVLRRKGR